MKKIHFTQSLLTAGILAAVASSAQAADVRINGFSSIVGGMTVKEGKTIDRLTGDPAKATFDAEPVTEGTYDDNLSFKPDSIYGLQFTADLGNKLKVVGQVTGAGGEDFEAEVSWAYISYDLTPTVTLQGGRQRLPLFLYSDYLDVGYAYHWIRVPTVLAAGALDTFEGAKISWTPTVGDWTYRTEVFGGAGNEYVGAIESETNFDNILGTTFKASNDWLQLRASYMQADAYTEGEYNEVLRDEEDEISSKNNPNQYSFWGVGAQANLGDGFIVAEYTNSETDRIVGYQYTPPETDDNPNPTAQDVQGFYEGNGWYISAGYRIGDFTPHITYAESNEKRKTINFQDGFDVASAEWTIGLRWDFHPSAALKAEYTTRSDESDKTYKEDFRGGYGESLEADVIAIGVDVIF